MNSARWSHKRSSKHIFFATLQKYSYMCPQLPLPRHRNMHIVIHNANCRCSSASNSLTSSRKGLREDATQYSMRVGQGKRRSNSYLAICSWVSRRKEVSSFMMNRFSFELPAVSNSPISNKVTFSANSFSAEVGNSYKQQSMKTAPLYRVITDCLLDFDSIFPTNFYISALKYCSICRQSKTFTCSSSEKGSSVSPKIIFFIILRTALPLKIWWFLQNSASQNRIWKCSSTSSQGRAVAFAVSKSCRKHSRHSSWLFFDAKVASMYILHVGRFKGSYCNTSPTRSSDCQGERRSMACARGDRQVTQARKDRYQLMAVRWAGSCPLADINTRLRYSSFAKAWSGSSRSVWVGSQNCAQKQPQR